MRGLILNNLYSIEKSVKTSIILASVAVIILVMTQHNMGLRAALFLPFLLIPVHAFEVLKYDAMSGWNKFETTLPVTRKQIVGSKYSTFLLLFMCSLMIIVFIFFVVDQFIYSVIDQLFFNFLLRGMGLIMCLAASTFMLTYKLGTEKSDSIMIGSAGFTFGVFFCISILLEIIPGNIQHIDEVFSLTFFGVAVICLFVSYILSVQIYKKKEF
jgi:hypothetical protein